MRAIVFAIALLCTLAHAPAALAHASLIRSEPADRATVAATPAAVRLTFNEPVSSLVMRLVGPGGQAVDLTNVTAADATVIVALPAALPRGTHLVSWRVISADGHPVGGAVTFSVGQPSVAPPEGPAFASSWQAIWLAKFMLYVGLLFGVGGAFYRAWIARAPPGRPIRFALGLGVAAAIISVGLQGADALGLPLVAPGEPRVWLAGLMTSYGVTACVAIVTCALALFGGTRFLTALALVGVGIALAASGHASSAEPRPYMRLVVFLHVVPIAFWVGALLPLFITMRAGRGEELARFSRAIALPFVVLVASGVILAVVQLRQFDALWTTAYGTILFRKLFFVLLLVALAAFNRWITPRAVAGDATALRRLGASILAEMAIVIVILGLVAFWRFTPPPRALIDAARAPVYAHIHTAKAMADITIERAGDGGRNISVTLLDGEFRPLAAKEVTLVLAKSEAGIEPLRLPASHVEATIWRIADVRLPAVGRWQAKIEILVSDFEKVAIEDNIELQP